MILFFFTISIISKVSNPYRITTVRESARNAGFYETDGTLMFQTLIVLLQSGNKIFYF